ncbi:MAG: sigma 54-interacting transcriptional regulator [Bacteroidales bacterium]|nr:sigma 54-interacting transcriptional regulator [Bacteroidales bacterium]
MINVDSGPEHKAKIRASHQRSLELGVEKERIRPSKILSDQALRLSQERNHRLLRIAGPFVQLLHEFVAESGFIIILTDEKGFILQLAGHEKTLQEIKPHSLIPGACMDTESIGTNAISIALEENTAIQVTGQEHFAKLFHNWSCSAAPIHDEKGTIIGCLNISGNIDKVYLHILGLIVASVKAIEFQVKSSFSEMRQKEAYRFVSQILNTLEFGVLGTDITGKIRRANHITSKLLRLPEEQIENKNLEDFVPDWPRLLNQVKNNEIILDEEVQISRFGFRDTFNLSVYPLTDGDGTINGSVVTLRDMKRVYKMVNKYTGMEARYNFDDLIGESDEMKRIIEYCKNISDSPSTVLIQGESGTGKEVLAQSIHNYSSRRDQGFVALNCGAIPETLIESELFGYTEGAFTSAKKGGKPGKFELANGGTLFLDEIGEMPPDMQVKLLRALQERAITRVGGEKLIPVDVRIIAATNRNLLQEIKKGKFRQDLYYRLSVIPVYIPPLRKRREDIPMLINFFLNLKSVKLRKQLPDMDNRLFKKLVYYDWPGNVRELENFIEKYVNLDGNLRLADEFLVDDVFQKEKTIGQDTQSEPDLKPEVESVNDPSEVVSLVELEKDAIQKAVEIYERNMTKVARALGISRNALYQKIKKYGLDV